MLVLVKVYCLLITSYFKFVFAYDLSIDPNIPEDGLLNFKKLSEKYGYPCEDYDVITEDGYILKMFRIKGDTGRPILLMHGLFDSSDTFIIRTNSSPGFALADAGYDVWFGNCRGNKYSRRHILLNPNKSKLFWDFSFHEFGVYDLPAMIDFILPSTGHSKIPVFGHSQGNLIFYVLGSMRPEYNAKVSVLLAVNPICHLHHVKGAVKLLVATWPVISPVLGLLGVVELFQTNTEASNLTTALCTQDNFLINGYDLCAKGVIFPIVGEDQKQLEEEFFSIMIGHFPAGTSKKDADHQLQLATHEVFAQFDYGPVGNVLHYGMTNSPPYNLSKVVMPVAMLVGKNDNIATVEDVEVLRGQLPNVVHYQLMEREKMNHIDMVWGKSMEVYLFPVMFNLFDKYAKYNTTV